jgi:hypothetical protein
MAGITLLSFHFPPAIHGGHNAGHGRGSNASDEVGPSK